MSQPASPQQVIEDFCNDFHLEEVKETMSQLVECAITTDNFPFAQATDRKGLLFFQSVLIEVFEAIYKSQDGRE